MTAAAVNLPLGFVKQSGAYHLAALLSFQNDSSLFIASDGRWIGSYIPAAFRSYPFRLMRREGSEEMVLCVDETSDLVRDADGEEFFFGEDGKPSEAVNQIADFLQKMESSRLATDAAVQALASADVIVPWEIKVKSNDGESPLNGFFRVDERKLNALDDQTYLTLRKAGSLGIAYGQIISMSRLEILGRLVEHQHRIENMQKQAAGKPLPQLNELFANDDKLIF